MNTNNIVTPHTNCTSNCNCRALRCTRMTVKLSSRKLETKRSYLWNARLFIFARRLTLFRGLIKSVVTILPIGQKKKTTPLDFVTCYVWSYLKLLTSSNTCCTLPREIDTAMYNNLQTFTHSLPTKNYTTPSLQLYWLLFYLKNNVILQL